MTLQEVYDQINLFRLQMSQSQFQQIPKNLRTQMN